MTFKAKHLDVRIETANYLLRPLSSRDVSEGWGNWLSDAVTADQLNAPCRKLSREELIEYVERFDNHDRWLLGIFHKPRNRHIGIFTAQASVNGRTVLWNVLVGEKEYRSAWGLRELKEVRVGVGRYFFFERGFEAAIASVVAHNKPIIAFLKVAGWELAKATPDLVQSARGGSPVEVLTFRLSKHAFSRRLLGQAGIPAGESR